eukprot:1398288-Amphidinium_carterae.1
MQSLPMWHSKAGCKVAELLLTLCSSARQHLKVGHYATVALPPHKLGLALQLNARLLSILAHTPGCSTTCFRSSWSCSTDLAPPQSWVS